MGKVIMSGIVPQLKKPITGIVASDIAVGSTVKLLESGVAVEYLVVHHGKPSSLYDDSCDGFWLLRKELYQNSFVWNAEKSDKYEDSDIYSFLNGTILELFDTETKAAIKQAKVPYRKGGWSGTDQNGVNGLQGKVFLLSCLELGWSDSLNYSFPADGAKLEYFDTWSTGNTKRVAKWGGIAYQCWTRTPSSALENGVWVVGSGGDITKFYSTSGKGVRPALILPSTAVFDEDTLIFKGVA